MLTDSEREWLEERSWCRFLFQCEKCPEYDPMRILPDKVEVPCKRFNHCATYTNSYDFADAAEFSERVAAKLATLLDESYFHIDTGSYESCREVCPAHSLCHKGFNPDCRATFVKYARLQVEEEKDV